MKENEMMTCQGHMTRIDDVDKALKDVTIPRIKLIKWEYVKYTWYVLMNVDKELKDITMPKGSMMIRWNWNGFELIMTWSTFWLNDDQVGQKIKVSEMIKWDKLWCKGDKRVGVNHFRVSRINTLVPRQKNC